MYLEEIFEAVLAGKASVGQNVQAALTAGIEPNDILHKGMIAAMDEIGRRFENHQAFVPEMLISARAMKEGMRVLKTSLIAADIKPVARVVLGTVQGDLHDIGKNLVGLMLEGGGFEVVDLGVDVSPQRFVEAIRQHQPGFVAMSSLLTTTMVYMEKTIKSIEEAGLRESVTIMVGGAPLTQRFASQIGADIFAPDASSGAKLARSHLKN
jgi:5-methyltetrahydrofolate--homocysteine methyltransferase